MPYLQALPWLTPRAVVITGSAQAKLVGRLFKQMLFGVMPSGVIFVATALLPCVFSLPLTEDNVIALRASAHAYELTPSASAIWIDEIAPTGTAVQLIIVPSIGPYACTLPGSASSNSGKLATAPGLSASFACVNAALGTPDVALPSHRSGLVHVFPNGSVSDIMLTAEHSSPFREIRSVATSTSSAGYFIVSPSAWSEGII